MRMTSLLAFWWKHSNQSHRLLTARRWISGPFRSSWDMAGGTAGKLSMTAANCALLKLRWPVCAWSETPTPSLYMLQNRKDLHHQCHHLSPDVPMKANRPGDASLVVAEKRGYTTDEKERSITKRAEKDPWALLELPGGRRIRCQMPHQHDETFLMSSFSGWTTGGGGGLLTENRYSI